MYLIIKYTLIIIIFIILLSLWVFYLAVRPIKIISPLTPASLGLAYENVAFQTADHVLIKGWFIPSKKPHAKTIILLHGYPADKGNILPSRIFLHRQFNLLLIDFRYLGESEGAYSTVGKKEILDLQAAIAYLHKRGIHTVGVWGFSLGAAVALMSAPTSPDIKAIVAEASYARLDLLADSHYPIPGLNYVIGQGLRLWSRVFLNIDINSMRPDQSIATLTIPILLIYSKNDDVINFQHAQIMEQATQGKTNVRMIIDENSQHGIPIENYQSVIEKFFTDALGK